MKKFFLIIFIFLMRCANGAGVFKIDENVIRMDLKGNEVYFSSIGVITDGGFEELKDFLTSREGEIYIIRGELGSGILELNFSIVQDDRVFLKALYEPKKKVRFVSFLFAIFLPGWKNSDVFINGMQSWSPSYITSIKRGDFDLNLVKGLDEWYDLLLSNPNLSWWWTGLRNEKKTFVGGAITFDKFKTRFFVSSKDNGAEIIFLNGNISEGMDGDVSSEILYISFDESLLVGFERYVEEVKSFYPPLEEPFNPVGWNSWNTFFKDIKFEDILQTMDFIKKEGLKINNIQIDDGWEKNWGDWDSENPSFGTDTKGFVSAVTSSGFTPGIWLAPFLADEESRVFKTHPSWFLKEDGKPLPYRFPLQGKRLYILDLTHPSAVEWMLKSIKKLLDEGYRYLKLDFLFAGLIEGERIVNTITSLQAFRSAMESIKRLAERYNAYILACGAPILPIAGLVNGARIGADIAFEGVPYNWNFIHNELRNLFLRLPLSKLFRLDPDTLLMREISYDEAKAFLVGILISGGIFALGDDLRSLEKEKINLIKRLESLSLFPPKSQNKFSSNEFVLIKQSVRFPSPVIGIDSPHDILPSIWYFSDNSGMYIAIFNWADQTREIRIPTKEIFGINPDKFIEVFTGERGREEMRLPPHGAILLKGG